MVRPEGKRQLGRPRSRREGNIKIYLKCMGWGVMNRIVVIQDRDGW